MNSTTTKAARASKPAARKFQITAAAFAALALAGCGVAAGHSSGAPKAKAHTGLTAHTESNTGSQTKPASQTKTGSAGKTAPAAATTINLQITPGVTAQLIAAAAGGIPANEFSGLQLVHYSYDPDTKTYWAGASLVANPSYLRAQVSTQDNGAYVIFHEVAGGPWVATDTGMGGIGGTPCGVAVPASVLNIWQWHTGACHPE